MAFITFFPRVDVAVLDTTLSLALLTTFFFFFFSTVLEGASVGSFVLASVML